MQPTKYTDDTTNHNIIAIQINLHKTSELNFFYNLWGFTFYAFNLEILFFFSV